MTSLSLYLHKRMRAPRTRIASLSGWSAASGVSDTRFCPPQYSIRVWGSWVDLPQIPAWEELKVLVPEPLYEQR